ncbi:methyl-accepting chemotaxis protein, partial [Pseudomonas syringae]
DLAQLANSARQDLILVRDEVRGYAGNPNDKTEAAAFQQLDSAISRLYRLKAAFGSANREQIAQFESALRNYRSAVDAFKATTQTAASVRKDLTTPGATIVKLGEELSGLQMQMGQEDTAQARRLPIGWVALVMVLGIPAAGVI